jgi:hypothetical protein
MSDAIVFISHNQIKPGKFDALKAYAPRVAEAIDRDKPGTVVFLMYADPEAPGPASSMSSQMAMPCNVTLRGRCASV